MRSTLAWLTVTGSLASVAAFNWYLGTSKIETSPIAASEVTIGDIGSTPTSELDLKAVPLIQAKTRPLFEKSRRQWVEPVKQLAEPAPELADAQIEVPIPKDVAPQEPIDARLIGIQRSPASTMVLLADGTGAAGDWFKAGASYKEWTVGEVTSNSVSLENAGKIFKLELYPSPTLAGSTP